ncbi:FlgD immunoglobulin-like domain containing protein [Mumia sp. DW29H23]|uniref:FlgD immunoglobulin-like domain containing protein n=1 Tax=Mumia sp. DW29H23 TaxID=3421241 RepID=UPI003D682863
MRRSLFPVLALALVPFVATPAAHAGTATPAVITPGKTATLTFTVPDPAPAAGSVALSVRNQQSTEVTHRTLDLTLPLVPGDVAASWDGRSTAGTAVPDGSYVATLEGDGAGIDTATVRVNLVAPRATSAPTVSAGTVFPWTDGYGDAVTLTSPGVTSEVTTTSALQVLNGSGAVVWTSTARSARWTGRTSAGAILPKGTYRVRTRFVDADGLVGYSPTRNVVVSAKRLVTRTVSETISPRGFLWDSYVGKCGKIVKPARKGKAWKQSISVSSNHKCTRKGARSITEAYFSARMTDVYDYRSFTITAVGAGHTKARKNFAIGYGLTASLDDISRTRRLSAKYGTRTVFSASGTSLRRYVDRNGWIAWGIATGDGGRYDVKALKVRTTYRALVDPTARAARLAPSGLQARG